MIVIGVMGIGLSAIFVRYAHAPSSITATYRLLWTVLLMTPMVFGKKQVRQELRQANKKTVAISLVSGLFLAIHFVVWFESLQHTSVVSSTTLVCTEVIWVSIGFCLFLKGKISLKAGLAIAISLGGSVLVAYADSVHGAHLYGDILALLSAIAVAIYMLLGRMARKTASTTVYTYLVYISCSVTLVLICLLQGNNILGYGSNTIIVGLLLAVFSTILGHSIFSWCLKYFSPSFVSASKLCEPIVAALFAAILFGEIPSPLQLLGGALILGGVFYYSRIEKQDS